MGGEADDWIKGRTEETERVERRRAWVSSTGWRCPMPAQPVGLALSGGGIRSATFSLGLLKSLSTAKILPCLDYLSTVSGGGYAGSFYCSLFVPQKMRGSTPDLNNAAAVEAAGKRANQLGCDVFNSWQGRQALAQLRQGGHYLAPNGTSDAVFAGAIGLRNWLAVALVTGLSVLALFLLIDFPLLFVREGLTALHDLKKPGTGPWIPQVPQDQLMGPWLAVLFLLSLWPAMCAWAFWFARSDPVPESRIERLASWQTAVALIIALVAFPITVRITGDFYPERWPTFWRFGLGTVSIGAIAVYALAEARSYSLDIASNGGEARCDRAAAISQEDRVRSILNRWLFRGVFVLTIAAALAAIAWLGREAYLAYEDGKKVWIGEWKLPAAAAFFTATVLPIARWLLKSPLGRSIENNYLKTLSQRAGSLAALVVGFVLLIIFLTFWSALAYAVMWDLMPQTPFRPGPGLQLTEEWESAAWPRATFTGLLLVCVILLGRIDALLNGSSLASFYGSRLRKAYLGATNEKRWGHSRVPVDKDHPADEIQLDAYYHDAVMAPLHLINVTINETTSKSSRVIQRDRKGKPMALSPEGCLYPAASLEGPLSLIRRDESEDLPLSSWMAISGAAFSTGAGKHTSLGTSVLAAMTNMRLGYWWYSRKKSRLGSLSHWVQFYLLREMRADYEGTGVDRWYLSDGGHHENTGVYELARRRIPFIVASDNGADPKYEFSDLVNLIRKLRIDQEAEIQFLDDEALDDIFGKTPLRNVFGTLEQIKRRGEQANEAAADSGKTPPAAGPYATIGRIRYRAEDGCRQPPTSTLIWIKPRITGKELPDLLQYRDTNLAFPQQPTADQFFDEAQWESYYRLGQLIGDMIFDEHRFKGHLDKCKWRPWDLAPLPDDNRPDDRAPRAIPNFAPLPGAATALTVPPDDRSGPDPGIRQNGEPLLA